MRTYQFEATNGVNWGRFMVGILDEEWSWESRVEPGQLLVNRWQWGRQHLWVMDLVTGEGAWFCHGSRARENLNKTKIRVCLLFEGFLAWLYEQDFDQIPDLAGQVVQLSHAVGFWSHRRTGQVVDDAVENNDVVRRVPSAQTSPQGPNSRDSPPAAAQADPGSSAENSGRRHNNSCAT